MSTTSPETEPGRLNGWKEIALHLGKGTRTVQRWEKLYGLPVHRIGREGGEIDHVELFGPPRRPDADSRNFVLCPGLAWDRSPCGTGTSAKMAVLAARGQLAPGERWRQESLTGSLFEGWLEERDGVLIPRVRGRAFVTGRATLFFDPRDPFREGFTSAR